MNEIVEMSIQGASLPAARRMGHLEIAYWAMMAVAVSIPFGEALRNLLGGLSVARGLIPCAFLALLVKRRKPLVHPLTPLAVAFNVLCLPSLVVGDSSYVSVATSFAGYLLMFQVIMAIARTSSAWIERLLIISTLSLGAVTALTLIARAGGPDFGELIGWPLMDVRFYPRVIGFENNPNGFATHFIVALPVVFHLLFVRRGVWLSMALLVLAVVLVLGLVLTLSRGAFLGACFGIGIYSVVTRRNIRPLAVAGILSLPLLIWAVLSLPPLLVSRFGDADSAYISADKSEAIAIREAMIPITLDVVWNNPLTGVGYDRFAQVLSQRSDWPYEWSGNPHNLPLGVAVEFGPLAFVALMALIVAACRNAWLSTRRSDPYQRRIAGLVLSTLCGLIFNSLFHYSLVNLSFWILVAMAGSFPIRARRFNKQRSICQPCPTA